MIRLRHQRARTERPNKVRPSDEDSFDLSRDIVKLLRACYIDVSYEAGVLETDSVDCEIHYVLDPHPYIQPEHGESQMFASIRYTLDQLGRLVLPPEQLALDSDGKLADESDLLRLSSLARWYDLLEKVAPNKLDGKNDPPIVPVDFLIDGSVLHLSVLPVHQIRDRKRRIAEGRWPLAYDQEKPVEPNIEFDPPVSGGSPPKEKEQEFNTKVAKRWFAVEGEDGRLYIDPYTQQLGILEKGDKLQGVCKLRGSYILREVVTVYPPNRQLLDDGGADEDADEDD